MGMVRSGSSVGFLGPFTVRTPSEEREEVMERGSTSAGILYFLLNSLAMKPCSSLLDSAGGGGRQLNQMCHFVVFQEMYTEEPCGAGS